MSTIDPSTIDPTKPAQGLPLTANVRANEQATQNNFTAAKTDIEALETGKVEEAPVDGQQYVREDAAWTTIPDPVLDHGGLTGLADDDHSQYHNDARGDARYYTQGQVDAGYAPLSHVGAGGTAHGAATGVLAGFMAPADKSKLDGVAPGAQTGDMLQSVYDTDASGIADGAESLAALVTNNSGATITKGTFVEVLTGATIILAQPTAGNWAHGAVAEDIANGATGRLMVEGILRDVDTSGAATGDPMYLDANGAYTLAKDPTKPTQRVGVIWIVHATTGTFQVDIQPPETPEAEGATGILVLTEASGTYDHVNASAVTWSEIVPGAGETQITQARNMKAGANAGRLAIDYAGTVGPQPAASSIGGSYTIHASVEFPAADTTLEVAFALNGTVIAAELAGIAAIGGNQTIGTAIPITLTVPLAGLSDGDELSVTTRGDPGTYLIHSLSVSFMSADGAGGGGGGGGGTDDHSALLNRGLPDQHPQSAVTGLVADLGARALQSSLDAHTGAATGAHAASAVSVVPTGGLAATDVQGGLAELDSDFAAHVGAGGAEHALVVASGAAGFMSGADKTKLDTFAPGYDLIQNDGGNLPAQTTMNAGAGLLAVDNAGATRTDWSVVAGTAIIADLNGVSVDVGTGGGQAAAGDHGHANATITVPGFMSAADKVRLDGVADNANDYSHPNHSGDVTSVGDGAQTIAANVVSNTKLADMASYTIKVRDAVSAGDPSDLKISGLTVEELTPSAGDWLLGETAAGQLARVDVGSLPGGGNVTSPGTTANLVQIGSGDPFGIADSVVDIADVARLSQAQTFTDDQTIAHAATTRLIIQSTDSVATFELYPGDGTPNDRRFGFVATSGQFFIFPLNDLGAPAGNELSLQHATGVLDASGLTVGGTAVLLPDVAATIGQVGYDATPTEHASAGDLTISYTDNQFFRVSGATTFSINVPVDGSLGACSVSIPSGTTVSLVGWTVSGTEPAGVARVVSLMSDENGHFARW